MECLQEMQSKIRPLLEELLQQARKREEIKKAFNQDWNKLYLKIKKSIQNAWNLRDLSKILINKKSNPFHPILMHKIKNLVCK
jgi:hypothetical protein